MVSHLVFSQLGQVALVWLGLMLPWAWPSDPAACPPPSASSPPLLQHYPSGDDSDTISLPDPTWGGM
jgi:hypothetical protein